MIGLAHLPSRRHIKGWLMIALSSKRRIIMAYATLVVLCLFLASPDLGHSVFGDENYFDICLQAGSACK